jgi:hypothetical protein
VKAYGVGGDLLLGICILFVVFVCIFGFGFWFLRPGVRMVVV